MTDTEVSFSTTFDRHSGDGGWVIKDLLAPKSPRTLEVEIKVEVWKKVISVSNTKDEKKREKRKNKKKREKIFLYKKQKEKKKRGREKVEKSYTH